MSITKKIRFEVFKRDVFTFQYCGKTPPNVTLEVDNIQPKSKEGLGIETVKEAMLKACSYIDDKDESIKYFCGICWNKINNNG